MDDLFSKKDKIQVQRIEDLDAKNSSDKFCNLERLILSHEEMYPNIDKWFSQRVVPGLRDSQRVGFVGLFNNVPMISAVVKKGKYSKFCHLKIGEQFQNLNLGEIFFSLMALVVRNHAKEIHFTLPESLWESKKSFFMSFGFNDFKIADMQYRNGIKEFKCSAEFKTVWNNVRYKFPKLMYHYSIGGYTNENKLLFSIKPEFASKIINGKKSIELRKTFSKKWLGSKVSIYASSPVQALIGYATINKVYEDTPENIWNLFHSEIGVSREKFEKYTKDKKKIFAIQLNEIHSYQDRVPLSQIKHLLDTDLNPPQSYLSLGNNKDWNEAISLATLLNANISKSKPDVVVL